jgi:hypothetical protein
MIPFFHDYQDFSKKILTALITDLFAQLVSSKFLFSITKVIMLEVTSCEGQKLMAEMVYISIK